MNVLKRVIKMSALSSTSPRRTLRNTLVLCIAFLLTFTGFGCSVSLLSSLHIEEGLGVVSQSIHYATSIVGAITTPPLVMKVLGVKGTIVVSGLMYAPYVAANFYPSWYTFIPSAVLVGLAGGPLWTSSLAYLSTMAKHQARHRESLNPDDLVFRNMGIFFGIFGLHNIIGNLVSFFVLKPDGSYAESNFTRPNFDLCGVNFCDWTAIQSRVIEKPPVDKVYLLTSLCLVCIMLGQMLALFCLDPLDLSELSSETALDAPFVQVVLAPLKRFRVPQHWLLLPITVFSGFKGSFLGGDYSKAYLACRLGVSHIGLAFISYGVVTTLASPFLGWLVKIVDRAYIFMTAGLFTAVGIGLLWVWTPDTPEYMLYAIPAIWGLSAVVWQSQVRALYGVLFSDDKSAAFAVHSTLEAVGLTFGFAISSLVCTEPKLWLLSVLLVVSLAGYGLADIIYRKDSVHVKYESLNDQLKSDDGCKNYHGDVFFKIPSHIVKNCNKNICN